MRTENEVREALAVALVAITKFNVPGFEDSRRSFTLIARTLNWILEREQFHGDTMEAMLEVHKEELRKAYPDAYHSMIENLSNIPLHMPL